MTFNVSEANNLNLLLNWAMGQPAWHGGPPVDDAKATEAARFLAARSLKAIGAGIRPDEVTLVQLTPASLDEGLRGMLGGHVDALSPADLDELDQLRQTIGLVLAEAGRMA